MAKKDDDYTDDILETESEYNPEANTIVEAYKTESDHALQLFEEAESLIDLSAVLDEAGFNADAIPLHELSNRPFVIRWMNSFESSYQKGDTVYHAICRDWDTGEIFRTIIGCKNGVEILKQLESKGIRSGIKLCFEYVVGKGRYGKYYRLK